MTFNPLDEEGVPIEDQFRNWSELNVEPYDKATVDPYTRTRVILMNGIEVESIMFGHQFARHTDDLELKRALAVNQDTGLNGAFVADLLSDLLTHERCGTHLYRSVAGRTHNPVLEAGYRRFEEETLHHVRVLEDLVAELGGNPRYVSPAARATEKADTAVLESTFLLGGSVDLMTRELVMLDAVLLAEAKDHANWSGLAELVDSFPEGSRRDAVRRAVDEVEPQEDDHLSWARTTRAKLIAMQVSSSTVQAIGTEAEELAARIEAWLR